MNAPSIAVTDHRAPYVLGRARALARALISPALESPPAMDEPTVALACAEGLGPLLGASIGRGRVVVPAGRTAALVLEHEMCLATHLVRDHAASAFAEACHRSCLPLAWLKGMALIPGVFRPGERSMLDVDALVPAARWDEACRIALDLGGRPVDFSSRPYTQAHDYVRAFTSASGVTIEVHRAVCESSLFRIDYERPGGVFARATPTSTGVMALDEGDLFLTLAAHAAKHTFELPLRSFFDGLAMLRRGSLQLDAITERAERWGMGTAFRLWMRALHALAPWLVKERERDSLRWPSLAERVWAQTRDASAWQRFMRLVWITDDPAEWARHILARVGMRVGDMALVLRGRVGPTG